MGWAVSSLLLIAVASAGMVLALGLTVRAWNGRCPPPLVIDAGVAFRRRLCEVLRRASALVAAGVFTGVLVLGFGLRLMMRIAGATSPDSAQGRITDAQEVVGEVTLGGTLFFVVGVGMLSGLATAGIWVMLRRWLPQRSVVAGAVLAALGAGVFARPSGLVDPRNHDFIILSPAWLAVLLSIMVLLAFGVSFAVLADRWVADWPDVGLTPRGIAAALPFLAAVAVSTPVVVPAVVMVAALIVGLRNRSRSAVVRRWLERSERPGRLIVGTSATVATVWVGISAAQVLTL